MQASRTRARLRRTFSSTHLPTKPVVPVMKTSLPASACVRKVAAAQERAVTSRKRPATSSHRQNYPTRKASREAARGGARCAFAASHSDVEDYFHSGSSSRNSSLSCACFFRDLSENSKPAMRRSWLVLLAVGSGALAVPAARHGETGHKSRQGGAGPAFPPLSLHCVACACCTWWPRPPWPSHRRTEAEATATAWQPRACALHAQRG